MNQDILIILQAFGKIAWNFWPAVLFGIAGLLWVASRER